jgi:hypothetical protein
MADSSKGAAGATESFFPISLTDLDLSNVVGGATMQVMQVPNIPGQTQAAPHLGSVLPQVASTVMCCW